MDRPVTRWFVLALIGFTVFAGAGHAEDPLVPLIERLKANPADSALRQEVIRLAAAQPKPPAVPEEARRYFVQGNSAFAEAKSPAELDRVVELYRNASNVAPWWADVYFNLAKALERGEKYDAAIVELKNYLLASPNAPDAREAQDKVYALEEKSARVSKAASEAAAAAQAQADAAAQRRAMASTLHSQLSMMFAGKIVYKGWVCSLNGDVFTGCTEAEYKGLNWWNFNPTYPTMGVKFDLSPDGEKILFSEGYDNGPQFGSGYFPPKVGTPTGYSLEQIQWVDDQGKKKTIDFWVSSSDGKTYYMISDAPGRPGDAAFDPNVRYQYWKHQLS